MGVGGPSESGRDFVRLIGIEQSVSSFAQEVSWKVRSNKMIMIRPTPGEFRMFVIDTTIQI